MIYSCSIETIFYVKILKFFYADPGSGMEKIRSGILVKHPGSTTLLSSFSVSTPNLHLCESVRCPGFFLNIGFICLDVNPDKS
jgi:hypothetical protein